MPDEPDQVEVQAISFEEFAEAREALAQTEAGEPTAEPLVNGSRPWVTVGCRFADSTNVTPRDEAYFNGLLGTTQPGIDHFWQQLSYNNVTLTGSQVAVWYNLPQPRSFYLDSSGNARLSALASHCTTAADADVSYPNFSGINLVFNKNLDCCAWGGSMTLTRDGVTKRYSMTWMPPWAYNNQYILGHEMGHGFGLPHSSGAYNTAYDSQWDPMSDGGTCQPSPHPTFGCLGDHTVSYHKDLLGWIPTGGKYVAAANTRSQSITLERLGVPSTGYLEAQIPIPGSTTKFYTVEARRFVDAGNYENAGPIPGEAVVIHRVNTTLGDRNAKVVDPDNNSNPNDAAAMWLPVETYTDAQNGISVQVTARTASGFNVNISTGGGGGDTVPPSNVTLTSHVDGQIVWGNEELSASATDNVGVTSVQFLVNGNSVGDDDTTPYTVNWDSTGVSDGYAVLAARAFDAASNSATSPGKIVIVDNTYPDTAITSGPPRRTKKTRATFTFVSSEANSTFRCSLDGRAYTACSSPKTYGGLSRRSHTFRVYAVGAGGATYDSDTTPAVRTWRVLRRR